MKKNNVVKNFEVYLNNLSYVYKSHLLIWINKKRLFYLF